MSAARPIMIMAGGTGGHVFPGLAVAEALKARDRAVVWLGTRRGLEARIVPDAGIELRIVSIAGLRRRGWMAWCTGPFRLAFAVLQVLGIFYRSRPAAVLGMGGFVAGPGGLAAWLMRLPLLVHEQNAIAGTTNRWLARFARGVFEAFPGSFPRRIHARWIGNPVRAAIAALPPPDQRFAQRPADRPLRLLVLGGSQGALALNRCVPAALALLPAAARPDVRHQAGRTLTETEQAYTAAGVTAELIPFIDDMADSYAWADLVVCRAGALTVAELAAAGIGAILVPYPFAVDDHQTRNAEQFVLDGAGIVVAEPQLTPARLAELLTELGAEPARLLAMAVAARAESRPDAAGQLADACARFAEARP